MLVIIFAPMVLVFTGPCGELSLTSCSADSVVRIVMYRQSVPRSFGCKARGTWTQGSSHQPITVLASRSSWPIRCACPGCVIFALTSSTAVSLALRVGRAAKFLAEHPSGAGCDDLLHCCDCHLIGRGRHRQTRWT